MTETVAEYLSFMVPPPVPDIPGPPVEAEPYPDDETMPTAKPMDLETVRMGLAPYRAQVEAMTKAATTQVVVDEATGKTATEMGNQAHKLLKAVEKVRDAAIDEPNTFVKEVRTLAKSFTEPLDAIKRALGKKLSDYTTRLELERRKAEEAARKAREEAQKRIDVEARTAGVEPPQLPEVVLPEPKTTVRTEEGISHQKRPWTYTVEDESKVPREYLMLDTVKINGAIRQGSRDIPGLKIFQETRTQFKG